MAGLTGTQFGAMIEQVCRRAGFSPRIVHRADDSVLHQALVAAGLGVGMLPEMACGDSDGVRFARIAPPAPRRHLSALLRRGSARRPALAATLEALRPRPG